MVEEEEERPCIIRGNVSLAHKGIIVDNGETMPGKEGQYSCTVYNTTGKSFKLQRN